MAIIIGSFCDLRINQECAVSKLISYVASYSLFNAIAVRLCVAACRKLQTSFMKFYGRHRDLVEACSHITYLGATYVEGFVHRM